MKIANLFKSNPAAFSLPLTGANACSDNFAKRKTGCASAGIVKERINLIKLIFLKFVQKLFRANFLLSAFSKNCFNGPLNFEFFLFSNKC
jgi:hypothetical protein